MTARIEAAVVGAAPDRPATPPPHVGQLAEPFVRLSALLGVLLVVAAGSGLFLSVYDGETSFARNGYRGADVVSLVIAVPLLVSATVAARRGSTRGLLLWLGALGYVAYQYGYAFAYQWNRLFLVYLTLLSLSSFTLAAALITLDARAVASHMDPRVRAKRVGTFLLTIGAGLGVMELAQIVPTLVTGDAPQIVTDTGHLTSPVFLLDLGAVVPLLLLVGIWLRRANPWGYVGAAIMLVKGISVGTGLLAANVFAAVDGGTTDGPLVVLWAAIAAGSTAALLHVLRHLGCAVSSAPGRAAP